MAAVRPHQSPGDAAVQPFHSPGQDAVRLYVRGGEGAALDQTLTPGAWRPPADQVESGRQAKGASAVAPEEVPRGSKGHIEWERRPLVGICQLMGRCWRNPVTGEIVLRPQRELFPDFYLVDLYRRPCLPSSMSDLAGDPYVLKPVVLTYRTWIYHEAMREGSAKTLAGQGETGMVKQALEAFVVDADKDAGRSSPIRRFAPFFLAAGLTSDDQLTIAAVFMTVCIVLLSFVMNNARAYRFERIATAAIRLPFFIYMCTRFKADDVLAIFGFLIVCGAFILDVACGDVEYIRSYRWHCRYSIVQELGKRLYVCKRDGAAGMDEGFEERAVNERVVGFSAWEPNHALIADIGGLLVELRPVLQKDWVHAFDLCNKTFPPRPLGYIGIDLFGPPGGQGVSFMDSSEWRLYEKAEEAAEKLRAVAKPPKAAQLELEDF